MIIMVMGCFLIMLQIYLQSSCCVFFVLFISESIVQVVCCSKSGNNNLFSELDDNLFCKHNHTNFF